MGERFIMWIAIMLVCFDPSALSCEVRAKPEAFYSERACREEAEAVAANMLKRNVYALLVFFSFLSLS